MVSRGEVVKGVLFVLHLTKEERASNVETGLTTHLEREKVRETDFCLCDAQKIHASKT
jgi:hypothetical protein